MWHTVTLMRLVNSDSALKTLIMTSISLERFSISVQSSDSQLILYFLEAIQKFIGSIFVLQYSHAQAITIIIIINYFIVTYCHIFPFILQLGHLLYIFLEDVCIVRSHQLLIHFQIVKGIYKIFIIKTGTVPEGVKNHLDQTQEKELGLLIPSLLTSPFYSSSLLCHSGADIISR